jgi:transcriptional regulator with XRE-family HTH domain
VSSVPIPTSQEELLRVARGTRTQLEFAQVLGVARSTLSRYESEKLGLPVHALNRCLEELAKLRADERGPAGEIVSELVDQASHLLDGLRRLI